VRWRWHPLGTRYLSSMARDMIYLGLAECSDALDTDASGCSDTGHDSATPPAFRRRWNPGVIVVSILGLAAVLATYACSEGAHDQKVELSELDISREVPLDDIAADRIGLPPPPCRCKGRRGAADAYHGGASPADSELCMAPWGGPYTPCFPLRATGGCPRGARKCTAAPPADAAHGASPPATESLANTTVGFGGDTVDRAEPPCLCVFDNDRTITAKVYTYIKDRRGRQRCSGTAAVPGTYDNAFGSGTLTLSAAAAGGFNRTACGACYVGVASYGGAGDGRMKRALVKRVLNTAPFKELAANHSDATRWSRGIRVPAASPLVLYAHDRLKQWAVEGILAWYWSKGVKIPRERVWHFDDRRDNVDYFAGTGFNARQVSCHSRDGNVGFCGATQQEISLAPGVQKCRHLKRAANATGRLRVRPEVGQNKTSQ